MERLCSTLFLASCAAVGCVALSHAPNALVDVGVLELVGDYVISESASPMPEAIEEVSGAWYDERSNQILAVSDRRDHPTLYTFAVDVSPPVRLTLRDARSVERAAPPQTLDLEGIAPASGDRLFMSSEGELLNAEQPSPGIFEYTREGRLLRALPLPPAYSGMRANLGIEGLSVSPDRRRLFAAVESSLRQDGPVATVESGALQRLLVYDLTARDASPREYAYRTEPVPRQGSERIARGENGVSEILALGDDDLLVLERAYVEHEGTSQRSANAIRIYRAHLDSSADITGRWSLSADPPTSVLAKTRVLDLSTLAPRLSPRLRSLENFEAMTFGPPMPDGRRTLLLISDNNGSDRQVTALVVLAFSIPKAQSPKPKGDGKQIRSRSR